MIVSAASSLYRTRLGALIAGVLLLALLAVPASATAAAAPALPAQHVGLLATHATPLDDDELDEIRGEWTGIAAAVTTIVAAYFINETFDYYGVGDWWQESALPAIESAVVSAYDTLKDAFGAYGAAAMEHPEAFGMTHGSL